MIRYSNNSGIVGNSVPLILYDGNSIWYDINESATVTKDGSNLVSKLTDKFGSGHDLIQVTGSKQPLLSDGELIFDGNDDFLQTATFSHESPISRFSVIRQSVWTLSKRIYDGFTSASTYITQNSLSPRFSFRLIDEHDEFPINVYFVLHALFNGASSKISCDDYPALEISDVAVNAAGITIGSRGDGGLNANIGLIEHIERTIVDTGANIIVIRNYLKSHNLDKINVGRFSKGYVLFSFDDGYAGVKTLGLPLFQSKGMSVTFYVNGSYAGTPGFLTWVQVKALYDAGMDVQCHAYEHVNYYDEFTEQEVYDDLDANSTAFVAAGLPAPQHFAYPRGTGADNGDVPTWVSTRRLTARSTLGHGSQINKGHYLHRLPVLGMDKASDQMDYLKEMMLATYNYNNAIILYAHQIVAGADGNYSINVDDLGELIDYAQSIGLEIITISELYDLM